ncbi:hypothetical protein ACSBR1_006473 [Camellia fascicularis]
MHSHIERATEIYIIFHVHRYRKRQLTFFKCLGLRRSLLSLSSLLSLYSLSLHPCFSL